ncbi:MAG TPA: hypothetical protein VIK71_07920 [Flavobacteriales bacterium]
MTRFLLPLLICLLQAATLSAQDTLLLMNGRTLDCRIVADSGTVFVFEHANKKGKIKVHEVHKSEVFSVKKQGEDELVLYAPNPMIGDIYAVEEMRFYMAGENDARNNYSAWPTFIAGFVLCGTISYLGEEGLLLSIVPPLVYTAAQLIPKIKIGEETISDMSYQYNDFYADGYEPPARTRKLIRALQGSYAGAAAGLAAFILFGK